MPFEAQAPLIVDAYAPLPLAVAFQGFKLVLRRNPQKREIGCRVQLLELAPRGLFEIDKACHVPVLEQGLGVLALEGFDHAEC